MRSTDRDLGSAGRAAKRSLGYLLAFPGVAAGAVACLMAGSGLAIAGPLVVRHLIDDGISRQDIFRLALLSIAFLALEAVRTGAEVSQSYLLRKLAQLTSGKLRMDVFRHLQRLPMTWFETNPVGRIVTRLTSDVAVLGEALSAGMIGLFRDLLVFLGVSAMILGLHPRFGAITLGSTLLVGIPAVLIRRSAQRLARLSLDAVSGANAILEENIAGHKVIRLFGVEDARGERFHHENEKFLQVSLSTLRARVFYDAGASVASALALTLIIGLGGAEMAAGRLSFGLLVAFVQYGSSLLGAVRGSAEKGVSLLSGIAAGERMFEMLDVPEGLEAQETPTSAPNLGQGIVISNLRFGYRPGVEVLKGVSAEIHGGERVALVGRTGAGKTTLARLMARLYDPWRGTISWDGRDLRHLPLEQLRRNVAFVTQEVSIFPATVFENISLGDPGVGRAEVTNACRAANAHAFIERLPRGYDSRLSEGGLELSVGERQLLSFARILVRQPKILILDEPTANVDPRTEESILDALDRVMKGRTSIIIAHRFSTLRGADRVLVVEEGRIVEEGEPGELLSKKGLFRTMDDHQRV